MSAIQNGVMQGYQCCGICGRRATECNCSHKFTGTPNQGWECPRCHAVMSPKIPSCMHCKPTHPNPGSLEAIQQLCSCAAKDNGLGKGRPAGLFYISADCPLHGENNERV